MKERIMYKVFACLMLLAICTGGLGFGRGEVASIAQVEDEIEIHLKEGKTQGYLTLYIYSSDKKTSLWELNLNYYNGGKIFLGKVPEGEQPVYKRKRKIKIRQKTPADGPPSFPKNETLYLVVDYYDTFLFIAPGMNSFGLTFELDDDGKLKTK